MEKSCILIPIHPPKFSYAILALETFIQYVNIGDLYFIFTNNNELEQFKKIDNLNHNFYKSLILSNEFIDYKNIISIKKLYGVNLLVTEYKYIAVLDSDIEFVKPFNLNEICSSIFNSNIFKSNVNDYGNHIKSIASQFELESNNSLIEETNNFNGSWWFNEMCVYHNQYFTEFYDWLQSHKNYEKFKNDTDIFDYLIYSIWLICFKNFKIKNISSIKTKFPALEHNNQQNSDEISMVFQSFTDSNRNHSNIEHIKIFIHTDRTHLKLLQ
jgi:hypothetical protein